MLKLKDETPTARPAGAVQPAVPALLLDVRDVAALLNVSTRSVLRLADRGAMPRAVKLGKLRRWQKKEILAWIDGGCPKASRSQFRG